jgi:outer membrane protein OmpA-like peptidoglycan-associated protein
MTGDVACTRYEQSSPCTQTIVTGAIGEVERPQSSEPEPSVAFATHASSEPISATEQFQLGAPKIATTSTEREDGSGKVGNRVDNGNERTGTVNAAAEREPLSAATPKTSLLLPQNAPADRYDCRELRTVSQSINISFDYARSSLEQEILPALETFAVRLRSCPSVKVIIEGHTDSDGRAAWNQSLSVRRAKAVLEHLCLYRRVAKSVVGDWIWAILPLRAQRVDEKQAQTDESCWLLMSVAELCLNSAASAAGRRDVPDARMQRICNCKS